MIKEHCRDVEKANIEPATCSPFKNIQSYREDRSHFQFGPSASFRITFIFNSLSARQTAF